MTFPIQSTERVNNHILSQSINWQKVNETNLTSLCKISPEVAKIMLKNLIFVLMGYQFSSMTISRKHNQHFSILQILPQNSRIKLLKQHKT